MKDPWFETSPFYQHSEQHQALNSSAAFIPQMSHESLSPNLSNEATPVESRRHWSSYSLRKDVVVKALLRAIWKILRDQYGVNTSSSLVDWERVNELWEHLSEGEQEASSRERNVCKDAIFLLLIHYPRRDSIPDISRDAWRVLSQFETAIVHYSKARISRLFWNRHFACIFNALIRSSLL